MKQPGEASPLMCPTCGARAMRHVHRDIDARAGGQKVTVRDVAIDECAECGERLYDLAALRKIREAKRSLPKDAA